MVNADARRSGARRLVPCSVPQALKEQHVSSPPARENPVSGGQQAYYLIHLTILKGVRLQHISLYVHKSLR